ncbi:MAG TPA: hypothetical protein PLP81_00250 [Saprospiraceae bacterium]|nr:hypothetical protein [Saprospiraceae bacterium]HND16237.1 hypothetical protein [Saprospiraceae bacterium]HNJ62915.1 hypothetical protein [Saprospiraceae bacterium]
MLTLFAVGFQAKLLQAQGYAFGLKGGLTAAFQTWDNYGRDALYKPHGILFIESADDDAGSLFAQIGYHIKGAANRPKGRTIYRDLQGNLIEYKPSVIEYQFHNLSLTAGFKKKYGFGSNFAYYLLGLRGDYTLKTNFDQYKEINKYYFFYPDDVYVKKWNYGVTVGGGFEFPFSELVRGIVEFTVNPDFSKQYRQPPITNIINGLGQVYNVPERQISNVTIELTVGMRFMNKIEYID